MTVTIDPCPQWGPFATFGNHIEWDFFEEYGPHQDRNTLPLRIGYEIVTYKSVPMPEEDIDWAPYWN